MCFCCCSTRQTINTFLLIITLSIFAYSIIAFISKASNTLLYEAFENRLDSVKLTSTKASSPSNNNNDNRRVSSLNAEITASNYKKYVDALKDINSYYYISSLTYSDLEGKKYNLLIALRGIENGFGYTFIALHIIFIIFIIIFLSDSCGNKEYTLSISSTFYSYIRMKTFCIAMSFIVIFVNLVYSALLSIVLSQYIQFIKNVNTDTFIQRIVVGMSYGVYGFFYYITLCCGFCADKSIYLNLGYEGNYGKIAQFHKDGKPIRRDIQDQNIVIFDRPVGKIELNPPTSKDSANIEELVKIEPVRKSKKNRTNINKDDSNQQLILSSSDDGKYLYYNGDTYMKMTTTISPPTD